MSAANRTFLGLILAGEMSVRPRGLQSDLLGHRNASITRNYAQPVLQQLQEIVERITDEEESRQTTMFGANSVTARHLRVTGKIWRPQGMLEGALAC